MVRATPLQQEIIAAFVHRLELVEDFVILAEEFGFCDNFNDIVFTVYLLQTMLGFFLFIARRTGNDLI